MIDWTDNAPQELKDVVQDAMSEGYHKDFDNFFDFLHACVDYYEESCNLDKVAETLSEESQR